LGHTRETGPDRVRTHLRFRPTHLHDCKGRATYIAEALYFHPHPHLPGLLPVPAPNGATG
jgi:hypothetical protein